jgi:hypothetical protein
VRLPVKDNKTLGVYGSIFTCHARRKFRILLLGPQRKRKKRKVKENWFPRSGRTGFTFY